MQNFEISKESFTECRRYAAPPRLMWYTTQKTKLEHTSTTMFEQSYSNIWKRNETDLVFLKDSQSFISLAYIFEITPKYFIEP